VELELLACRALRESKEISEIPGRSVQPERQVPRVEQEQSERPERRETQATLELPVQVVKRVIPGHRASGVQRVLRVYRVAKVTPEIPDIPDIPDELVFWVQPEPPELRESRVLRAQLE